MTSHEIALEEAAHAVCAAWLGYPIRLATVDPGDPRVELANDPTGDPAKEIACRLVGPLVRSITPDLLLFPPRDGAPPNDVYASRVIACSATRTITDALELEEEGRQLARDLLADPVFRELVELVATLLEEFTELQGGTIAEVVAEHRKACAR